MSELAAAHHLCHHNQQNNGDGVGSGRKRSTCRPGCRFFFHFFAAAFDDDDDDETMEVRRMMMVNKTYSEEEGGHLAVAVVNDATITNLKWFFLWFLVILPGVSGTCQFVSGHFSHIANDEEPFVSHSKTPSSHSPHFNSFTCLTHAPVIMGRHLPYNRTEKSGKGWKGTHTHTHTHTHTYTQWWWWRWSTTIMRELWGESSVSNARRDSFILVTMYDKVYKRDKCNGQMRRTLARPTTTEVCLPFSLFHHPFTL